MKFTKETLRRMLRTFLQAAFGFLASTGIAVLTTNEYNVSRSVIIGLLGSALAAGMAAVMNLEQPTSDNAEDIEGDEIDA